MIFGSVCSGIEGASQAWDPLGWTPSFFAEIAPFPSKLLAYRYPHVPNVGDFTQPVHRDLHLAPIDLLVGGTPCQAFSVAGLRGGLADARGNLALEFLRLAGRLHPRWIVWENVPGVLSVDGGRAFGSFLGGLAELGYGFAYRVLDAQFFGVPQRRRRVFVVGCAGGAWDRAAAVLFEPESLRGDPGPRRKARAEDPRAVGEGPAGGGDRFFRMEAFGQYRSSPTSSTLKARDYKDAVDLVVGSLTANAVRRLTPRECERLQGFPDDYTNIPGASDAARYKALGNSFAVPVVRWIGSRIDKIDSQYL